MILKNEIVIKKNFMLIKKYWKIKIWLKSGQSKPLHTADTQVDKSFENDLNIVSELSFTKH